MCIWNVSAFFLINILTCALTADVINSVNQFNITCSRPFYPNKYIVLIKVEPVETLNKLKDGLTCVSISVKCTLDQNISRKVACFQGQAKKRQEWNSDRCPKQPVSLKQFSENITQIRTQGRFCDSIIFDLGPEMVEITRSQPLTLWTILMPIFATVLFIFTLGSFVLLLKMIAMKKKLEKATREPIKQEFVLQRESVEDHIYEDVEKYNTDYDNQN